MRLKTGQQTIREVIEDEFSKSDQVEIAVGYVSKASLEELNHLIEKNNICNIALLIGMYYTEGMPESIYRTALKLDKQWKANGIGQIKIIKPFTYHGKIYLFSKQKKEIAGIIGSANLSVLKPEASTLRQYESSVITENVGECQELKNFIDELNQPGISEDINNIDNMPIIREVNKSLYGIELVSQKTDTQVELYKHHETNVSFRLPLKVPAYKDRLKIGREYYTKSNINVCYAAPRTKYKPRDWFETQITVTKEITRINGYPQHNVPFFIITDDGYWFKAHTTSSGNKQFAAVGDELIMGRWIKGRLAAAGLVNPVNDTSKDVNRDGMITKEMLEEYGCDSLVFSKTSEKALDENGNELDVWVLSFESSKKE